MPPGGFTAAIQQLQKHTYAMDLAAPFYLYVSLDLREQVDELDVGGQQESSSGQRAEVVLRVKQPELKQKLKVENGAKLRLRGPLRNSIDCGSIER